MNFIYIFVIIAITNGNVINNSKSLKNIKQELSDEDDSKLPPPIPPNVSNQVDSLDDIDSMILNSKKPIYKTNVLFCMNKKYYSIERFKVTEPDFNCNDKFLEIHFEYVDLHGRIKIHKGYLSNDTENAYCVQEHQERSAICKKIKRCFQIN